MPLNILYRCTTLQLLLVLLHRCTMVLSHTAHRGVSTCILSKFMTLYESPPSRFFSLISSTAFTANTDAAQLRMKLKNRNAAAEGLADIARHVIGCH